MYHEGGGGSSVEFAAAQGIKAAFDGDFRLVGHRSIGLLPVAGLTGKVTVTGTKPGAYSAGAIVDLANAQAALAEGATNNTNVEGQYSVTDLTDPAFPNDGAFPGGTPFPNDTPNDDNDFAIRVEGVIEIKQGGKYQLGFNSDDGGALKVAGITWDTIVADGTGTAVINGEWLENDALTGRSFTAGEAYLSAGSHAFEVIMFERGGAANLEVFARGLSSCGGWDPIWRLLTVDGPRCVQDIDGLQLCGALAGNDCCHCTCAGRRSLRCGTRTSRHRTFLRCRCSQSWH